MKYPPDDEIRSSFYEPGVWDGDGGVADLRRLYPELAELPDDELRAAVRAKGAARARADADRTRADLEAELDAILGRDTEPDD